MVITTRNKSSLYRYIYTEGLLSDSLPIPSPDPIASTPDEAANHLPIPLTLSKGVTIHKFLRWTNPSKSTAPSLIRPLLQICGVCRSAPSSSGVNTPGGIAWLGPRCNHKPARKCRIRCGQIRCWKALIGAKRANGGRMRGCM